MANFSGLKIKHKDDARAGSYPSIRIFKNSILEWCTHVHPVVPILLWGPVSLYWLYSGAFGQGLELGEVFLWAFLGLISWTLMEYLLHRFVFHFPAKSKVTKYLVFLFHGLHHDDPNDPTRLVFPPVPAIAIVFGLYHFFALIIPDSSHHIFMGTFMIGYLCYDYIHYATHHFKMTSKVGRVLKKNHLQHHNLHEPVKFGVSSPLWDYVFGSFHSTREKGKFQRSES